MSYQEKSVFTKVAVNGKKSAAWPNFLGLWVRYLGTYLYVYIISQLSSMNKEAKITMSKLPFQLRQAKKSLLNRE